MPKEDFLAQIGPYAQKVGAEIGVDPRVIMAQAALETGWGKSAPGNNYFGIKSHGKGGGNTLSTKEVIDGKEVTINDSFRGYEDIGDSVAGYGEFLKENPRYKDMLSAGSLEDQIAALGASGYATDPEYANKISSIVGGIDPNAEFALPSVGVGPTQARADAGLGLTVPTGPQAGVADAPPSFYEDEYADNWLGRVSKSKDTMRAGLGEKLGINADQMQGIGGGLQGLGGFISRGGFG